MNGPTPDKVMQLITGAWGASILGAAARHGLFTALEGNPDTADGLAKKTGISARGAQALLDGLTGLGILTVSNGKYQNTPEASAFLVKDKPSYLGALAEVFLEEEHLAPGFVLVAMRVKLEVLLAEPFAIPGHGSERSGQKRSEIEDRRSGRLCLIICSRKRILMSHERSQIRDQAAF